MAQQKLEPFDKKFTKYQGLWYDSVGHCFKSAVINLAQIKQFKGNIVLRVVKNKYFEGGKNGRPNYLFSIIDAKSDKPRSFEIDEIDEIDEDAVMDNLYEINGQCGVFVPMNGEINTDLCERLYTKAEVQKAINGAACDAGGDGWYGECLVSDYL